MSIQAAAYYESARRRVLRSPWIGGRKPNCARQLSVRIRPAWVL